MKGYKAFNSDLTCLCYQYELDKTHFFEGVPVLCKSGFHFCTELQDVVNYYCYSDMRVFEIEASGVITEAEEDCSKRACSELELIRELSLNEVAQSITDPKLAYLWARDIGNRDVMIDKIDDSENAYWWAVSIGNKDIMIDRIKDSYWAFWWAKVIGNKEEMIDRIDNYIYAKNWIYYWPEDKQYFIDKGIIK